MSHPKRYLYKANSGVVTKPPGNSFISSALEDVTLKKKSENFLKKHLIACVYTYMTSLVAQTVKRLPTMQETWVQSLGWEDLLEKEMATHSSILAWKIPWMEESGRLQTMVSQRIGHNGVTSCVYIYTHMYIACSYTYYIYL